MMAATATRPTPSARAEFATSVRKIAAHRKRLIDPPPFDRPRFEAVAAEIERALEADDDHRARRLIEGWERVELRELGQT